ncbi:hypothetical protein DY000_02033173 [Brassica cretica]|uniref:Uncharacterized protein n=1 Tax=Brassica cretica TaxID=69181 RepID=A0ABQ7DGZ2_BRACR|nr:hypothetical protein DY000_02033173 [Brassica cretica]
MKVDEATEGRRLRKRKEKIPKNLKREANEKEMDGFTKRVLRIPVEKPFDEGKDETKDHLKKKSDPGKFAIPCVVKACHCGAEYETEYSEMIDTRLVLALLTRT